MRVGENGFGRWMLRPTYRVIGHVIDIIFGFGLLRKLFLIKSNCHTFKSHFVDIGVMYYNILLIIGVIYYKLFVHYILTCF